MTKGLVALINSKTAITDVIGNRFYPRILPQGLSTFPAATFRVNNNIDHSDFDGASRYDFAFIDIWCYAKKDPSGYAKANELYELFRKELEESSGTYNGVEIEYVKYMPSGAEDYLDNLELYSKQLELRISYKRNLN